MVKATSFITISLDTLDLPHHITLIQQIKPKSFKEEHQMKCKGMK
jgi:hypothetical protein